MTLQTKENQRVPLAYKTNVVAPVISGVSLKKHMMDLLQVAKKIADVLLEFSELKHPSLKSEGLTGDYYLKKGNLWANIDTFCGRVSFFPFLSVFLPWKLCGGEYQTSVQYSV